MKYAAYGFLAAFLAQGVYGAIPTSAEGWYTPSGGFSRQSGSGTVVWNDEDGYEHSSTVTVDDEGKISGGMVDFQGNAALKTAYNALVKACDAEAWNAVQDEAISTIAGNLDSIFRTDGIQMEMEKQGPGGSTSTATYTLKIKPGGSGGSSATIEATDPIPYGNVVDGKTVGWTRNSAAGQLQMYGANAATASTDEWWNDYGFFVPFLKDAGALGWKRYGGWYDGVFGTMASDGRTMLTLAGWTGGRECNTDMCRILTEKAGDNRANHYVLTRYGTGTDAVFHYVPFGDRLEFGNGSPVDGSSITTNTADGAKTQGDASLYGWANAEVEGIPQKGDGHLKWTAPGDMVDGTSLALTDKGDGGKVWEVKDAHLYAGQHAKHYFGTGNDKTAVLGWHELPNATTNMVVGDEVTISSNPNIPDLTPEEGVKHLGLRGWDYGYAGSDPAFLVNRGGELDYVPLPAITNLAACACTNKWNALLGWIDDGEMDGDDGIVFSDSTLDQYLYGTLGYIYSTTPGNLHFDNDGDQIQASFAAPENWTDGVSVDLTDDGRYQIKGFANASPCATSVSAMLSEPTGSDAATHLLLARKTDTGALHYVPVGSGVAGGGEHADGVTIVTNTAQGAATQGLLSLYGWSAAQDGKVLTKRNNAVSWEDGGTPPDDVTLAVVAEGSGAEAAERLTIKGFAAAENGTIPWKDEEGNFKWGGFSSATNILLAGAGINITDNGGGAITISASATTSGGEGGGSGNETDTLTVVTDVRYYEETHTFQKKTRTLSFRGYAGDESGWTDVFSTVSHQSEHENAASGGSSSGE